MSVIKTEKFAQLLSEYSGTSVEEALSFLKSFSSVISNTVKNGEDVDVQGLGKFILIDTKQAEMRRIALMLAESMKNEVNSPFSFFEPYLISKGKSVTDSSEEKIAEEYIEGPQSIVVIEENDQPGSSREEIVTDSELDKEETVDETEKQEIVTPEDEKKLDNISTETKHNHRNIIIVSLIVLIAVLSILYSFFKSQEAGSVVADAQNVRVSEVLDSVPVIDDRLLELPKDTAASAILQSEVLKVGNDFVNHRLLDSIGNPVTVTLQSGERLTLIALKYFGSKDFWPYVFDVNCDKLKSPSNVKTGTLLYLPDKEYFMIDANSEESLNKARKRGIELLNK